MEGIKFDYGIFADANLYYVAIIAYLIGCVPYAVIVGYLGGIGDIRQLGSGNPGATNMAREGGKKLGAITLLLDALKGVLAVYIGRNMGYAAAATLFVVIGHCFSIILKFKGGKGVATTLGGLLALNLCVGLVYLGSWLVIFAIWRVSALGGIIGIWITALVSIFLWSGNIMLLAIFFAVLITIRHKSNIKAMIAERKQNRA